MHREGDNKRQARKGANVLKVVWYDISDIRKTVKKYSLI